MGEITPAAATKQWREITSFLQEKGATHQELLQIYQHSRTKIRFSLLFYSLCFWLQRDYPQGHADRLIDLPTLQAIIKTQLQLWGSVAAIAQFYTTFPIAEAIHPIELRYLLQMAIAPLFLAETPLALALARQQSLKHIDTITLLIDGSSADDLLLDDGQRLLEVLSFTPGKLTYMDLFIFDEQDNPLFNQTSGHLNDPSICLTSEAAIYFHPSTGAKIQLNTAPDGSHLHPKYTHSLMLASDAKGLVWSLADRRVLTTLGYTLKPVDPMD